MSPPSGAFVMAPSRLNQFQSIPRHSSKAATPACHRRRKTPIHHPLLTAIMSGGFGTQVGLVERLPMAAGA